MGVERTPNKSQHAQSTLEMQILPPLLPGFENNSGGSRDSLLAERRTHDRKVASSNPGRSGGRISSKVCVLTLIRCPFHPHVTAVARKRPRSFCQKCRWQVTHKHEYIPDPTKSEWADYAVQAQCGNLSGKRAYMQVVRKHSATVFSAC